MTRRHPSVLRYAARLFPLLLLACLPTAAWPIDLLSQLEQQVSLGTYGNVDSLLIWRDGELLMEEYYNGYNADRLHNLYSTTKSVTSALVGIAIDSGAIDGVGSRMLDFFSDYTPANMDARKEAITLDDMLKMQAGFLWDEVSIPYGSPGNSLYEMTHSGRDWMEYVLDLEMSAASGGEFTYNSGSTLLLSRVLSESVGTTVGGFADNTLFADLNIGPSRWEATPQGDTNTGWGLGLRPRDMLKFGQLYLNDGYWQPEGQLEGKQVVSSQWVAESTQPYLDEGISGGPGTTLFNYGYQWWRFQDGSEEVSELAVNDVYFSRGYGGQFIFVVPHLELVVVTTATADLDSDEFFPALSSFIFPAIQQRTVANVQVPEVSAIYATIDDDSGSGLDGLGDITSNRLSKPSGFVGELDTDSTNRIGRLVAKFALPDVDEARPVLTSATLSFFLTEVDGTPAGPVSLFHSVADNDEDLLASDYEETTYVDTELDLVGPAAEAGRYYELDVTDLVSADYAADGPNAFSAFRLQVTEAMFAEDNLSARYRFTMPGAKVNRPELLLVFIPEPSTLILVAVGLLGFLACGRQRRKPQ